MLAGLALPCEEPLRHPFALRRAGLHVQAHVVDGRDVRQQPHAGVPRTEAVAGRLQPRARRDDPRGLADEQPAGRDQAGVAQPRDDTLHGAWPAAQQDLQLVCAGAVLLAEPARQLEVTAAQGFVAITAAGGAMRRGAHAAARRPPGALEKHGAHRLPPVGLSRRYQPSLRLTNRVVLARYRCAETRPAETPSALAICTGPRARVLGEIRRDVVLGYLPGRGSPRAGSARAARNRSRSASNSS